MLGLDSTVSGNLCICIVCKPGDDASEGKSRDFPQEEEVEEVGETEEEEEGVVLHSFLTPEENFLLQTLIDLNLRTLPKLESVTREGVNLSFASQSKSLVKGEQMMLTTQICPPKRC